MVVLAAPSKKADEGDVGGKNRYKEDEGWTLARVSITPNVLVADALRCAAIIAKCSLVKLSTRLSLCGTDTEAAAQIVAGRHCYGPSTVHTLGPAGKTGRLKKRVARKDSR